MGTKESLYDLNGLNKVNVGKNISKESLENIKLHKKDNLYKRDTSRSQHTSQVNTEPNTKTKKNKNKKKQIMTKEQRILLKKLLKENVKENNRRIAKNLIGIFLESSKNNIIYNTGKAKIKKKHSETLKSKFFKKGIKKDKMSIRRYSSVCNFHLSHFKKQNKQIEKNKDNCVDNNNKNDNHHTINDSKNDDLPDNHHIEIFGINDDSNDNDNDDDENVNDFGILNFTSLAKMSIGINDSINTNPNQKDSESEIKIEERNLNENKGIVLQRKSFRDFVENNIKRHYAECLKFINTTNVLSHLEESDKSLLVQSLKIKNFKKDEYILKSDSKINKMFFVKEGLIRCLDDEGHCLRTLTVGDFFGENEILMHKTNNENKISIIAISDCICYSISIRSFKKMFRCKFGNFLFFNFMKDAFDCSKLFQNLNYFYIKKIFKFFSIINLNKDNVAFPIGHIKSSKFVIIVSGNLDSFHFDFD